VTECPSCGAGLPEGARFCAFCGTAIPAHPRSEERRTVTILFVDLVGFTERSDRADPEDVRQTLVPFHGRVKHDLERFGGTLDKFIGDGALGVFGSPVAHEDDPLRAVRAALQILKSVQDLRKYDPDVAVRVAVNTGEAVVSFGVGPQVGEAVAGDVVNTASRMQSLAPRDAVVIGEATLGAVRDRFEVEALPAATVKGKRDPLRVWRVIGERVEAEMERAPFVGRRTELATLAEVFREVERSSACHVVTIVGEAGVGKSRLVAEFTERLGDRARRVTGVCLPYGEGVTFAPIEQTLRELGGIAPSDDAATSVARVEALATSIEADPQDRRWLIRTLDMVLAPETAPPESETAPDEIAQAWARVLAAAVDGRPIVIVIEDLHRASPAFVDVAADTAGLLGTRSALILATTRPEIAVPDAWVSLPRTSTMSLGVLSGAEARALLGSVLPDGVVSEVARGTVLERSAGNPLYAVEFARMLSESDAAELVAMPASVHAVIAARLDAVPDDIRGLVLDAAVLGEEVWPEALANLNDRPVPEVRQGLALLERRGLLEHRESSFPGSDAYGFAHSLIREVAYGRLPRAARARRHLSAARWLASASGKRSEEWAESLARHYATATELGRASGERAVAERASAAALRWLVVAGDRAARVDPAAAFATFDRALEFAAEGTRERQEALWRSGVAGRRSGLLDADAVLARYDEALAIARSQGDEIAVGEGLTRVGAQLAAVGEVQRARSCFVEAVEALERNAPGRALATAYAHRSQDELFAGDTFEAMTLADRALALLEDDLDEVAVMALHLRGDARCSTGDLAGGLADLGEALRRAEEAGRVSDVVTSRNYLAEWRWATEGPAAGLTEWEMSLELAERRNVRSQALYAKGSSLSVLLELGEWDRVLDWSAELLGLPPERIDPAVSVVAITARTHVLLARGRGSEVTDPDELVGVAEQTQELHALAPAIIAAAAVALTDGALDAAASRLEAFESITEGVAAEHRAVELVRAVRLSLKVGRSDIAERLVAKADPKTLRDRLKLDAARAMLAEAHGDPEAAEAYARIAERERTYGDPFEEAMALLGCARLTGTEQPRASADALLEHLGVPT
jgi:class 3 adenylate cyclase/predicted ATPase